MEAWDRDRPKRAAANGPEVTALARRWGAPQLRPAPAASPGPEKRAKQRPRRGATAPGPKGYCPDYRNLRTTRSLSVTF
ncbi:hypothetical protein [Lysobacter gummosus]|uniref:hypothetical protein n=1 Tax=Lysobacter gummosus TaxID=262324 RepID=UPI00363F481C